MKTSFKLRILTLVILTFSFVTESKAQYYEIANQIPSLIRPALSGSMNYRGFIEGGYSKTFGSNDADFIEFSTSQGFQYSSWFYMGVGLGADILTAHRNDGWGSWNPDSQFDYNHPSTKSAVMMPVFTDFRFTLGDSMLASFYIDLKIGCSFLLSDRYIEIGNGFLTNQQYFYLRPTLGIRIPISKDHPKQAVDIGINYKLLTSNYWYSWSRTVSLNSLGASIAFEW